MARQEVDIGIEGNDGTGDSIRESFRKVNENFQEIYAVVGKGGQITFTLLADTPDDLTPFKGDGVDAYLPMVSQDGTEIEVRKLGSDSDENAAAVDTISINVSEDGKLILKLNAISLESDPSPTLGGPLNAAGVAIANIGTTNTDVTNFNNVHGTSLTQDDLVIDKKFGDKNYIRRQDPGETINVPSEFTEATSYTKSIDSIQSLQINNLGYTGIALIPSHGLTRGSDGSAYVFNTAGTGLNWSRQDPATGNTISSTDVDSNGALIYSPIQNGDTIYVGILDANNLGFFVSASDAQLEDLTERNNRRYTLSTTDSAALSITDAGYDADLEGFFLSHQVMPRDAITRRQGDTMEGPLTLHDHPGDLAGAGTPNGLADLQAVSKLYVDSQSTESSANIFVSSVGSDDQSVAPPGKEGSSLAYAYKTIGAAARKAEQIQIASPFEPGPYMQDIFTSRVVSEGEAPTIELSQVTQTGFAVGGGLDSRGNAKTLVEANLNYIIAEVVAWKDAQITSKATTTVGTTTVNWTNRVVGDRALELDLRKGLTAALLDHVAGTLAQSLSVRVGVEFYNDEYTRSQSGLLKNVYAHLLERARTVTASVITNTPFTSLQTIYTQDIITYGSNQPDSDDAGSITANLAVQRDVVTSGVFTAPVARTGNRYELFFSNSVNGVTQGKVDQGDPKNRDLRVGKVIRGKTSGAIGKIIRYFPGNDNVNNPGSLDDLAELELLSAQEFTTGEQLEMGNIVNNRQITVRIETGQYFEDYPIKVPANVSLVGDEFRRVIIRPKAEVSQSPWATTYFYRDKTFDGLTGGNDSITGTGDPNLPTDGEAYINPLSGETDGYFGRHYLYNPNLTKNVDNGGALAITNTGQYNDAAVLIEKNKDFIIAENIAYLDYAKAQSNAGDANFSGYAGVVWSNSAKDRYRRTIGSLVDAIANDLRTGGSTNTLHIQGSIFFDGINYSNEATPRYQSIIAAGDVIQNVIINNAYNNSLYTAYKGADHPTQYINANLSGGASIAGNGNLVYDLFELLKWGNDSTPNDDWNPAKRSTQLDAFLMNDATILRNMTVQGHGGFMCVLDPTGQILTKSPYIQTGSSFSQSLNQQAFRGGMLVDAFCANTPIKVTAVQANGFELLVTADPGSGLSIRKPQTPAPFYINGIRYQVNDITDYNDGGLLAPTATLILDSTSGPVSDVDPDVTVGWDTVELPIPPGGYPVTLQTAGNRSQLGNDFTQVNDLAYGLVTINGGLSEMVSMFTYYCHTAYYAGNGGQIRSLNGSNANGVYGLVAQGSDPNEVPDDVVLKDDMMQSAKTFSAITVLELDQNVSVAAGDTIANAASTPSASGTSVFASVGKKLYLDSTSGSFTVGASIFVNNVDSGADITKVDTTGYTNIATQLSVHVYDLEHIPSNKGEIDYYHDDGVTPTNRIARYEVANIQKVNGILVDGYTIDNTEYTFTPVARTPNVNGVIGVNELGPVSETTEAVIVVSKANKDGGIYGVSIFGTERGDHYKIGDTFTIAGTQLGGTSPANNATVTVTEINRSAANIDSGIQTGSIRRMTISGSINSIAGYTPERDGQVYKLNFSTSNDQFDNDGLLADIPINKPVDIRNNQTHLFRDIESVGSLTIRPSTAVNFDDDPVDTYRSISFGVNNSAGALLEDDEALTGFDATYDYVGLLVDPTYIQTAGSTVNPSVSSTTLGNTQGDTTIAISVLTQLKDIWRLNNNFDTDAQFQSIPTDDTGRDFSITYELPKVISWRGKKHVICNYREVKIESGVHNVKTTFSEDHTYALVDLKEVSEVKLTLNEKASWDRDVFFNLAQRQVLVRQVGNTSANGKVKVKQVNEQVLDLYDWSGVAFNTTGALEISVDAGASYSTMTDLATGLVNIVPTLVQVKDTNVTGVATGISQPVTQGFNSPITLRAGLQDGAPAKITIQISTCRATGHDFLDIGTGSFNQTNYPNVILGFPAREADQANEINERNKGRVFFVSTDQDGFFRVGRFFTVDQGTGTVTFAASIALSDVDGIGFKRGVVVTEFSTDSAMSDNANDTVPVESAVRGYVNRRLGYDQQGVEVSNPLGPSVITQNGAKAFTGDQSMGQNNLVDLAPVDLLLTSGSTAVNKDYVDSRSEGVKKAKTLRDVEISTGDANQMLGLTGTYSLYLDANAGNAGAFVPGKVLTNSAATNNFGTVTGKYDFYDSGLGDVVVVYFTKGPDIASLTEYNLNIGAGTISGLKAGAPDVYSKASAGSGTTDGQSKYINGPFQEIINIGEEPFNTGTPVSDISFTTRRLVNDDDPSNVSLPDRPTAYFDMQINDEVIINDDVNPTAAIVQSKLNMKEADTFVTAAGDQIVISAQEVVQGFTYEVVLQGTTNFGALGAGASTPGTVFTATASNPNITGGGTVKRIQSNIVVKELVNTDTYTTNQAKLGLSAFDGANFKVTRGHVGLKDNGIPKSKLEQIAADTVLGNSTSAEANVAEVAFTTVVDEGQGIQHTDFATTQATGVMTRTLETAGSETYLVVNATTTGEASSFVKTNGAGVIDAQGYALNNNSVLTQIGAGASGVLTITSIQGGKSIQATGGDSTTSAYTTIFGNLNVGDLKDPDGTDPDSDPDIFDQSELHAAADAASITAGNAPAGTVTPFAASQWMYTNFIEAQNEKGGTSAGIAIGAYSGKTEAGKVAIVVSNGTTQKAITFGMFDSTGDNTEDTLAITPDDDNTTDIGGTNLRFKTGYFENMNVAASVTSAGITAGNIKVGETSDNEIDTTSGNLTIDSEGGTVTIDDILSVSGTASFSSTLTVTSTTTLNGDVNLGNATGDDIKINGKVNTDIIPKGATHDLGDGTNTFAKTFTRELTTGASGTTGTITGDWSLSSGSKLQSTYADLAEMYSADTEYEVGTVLVFGGDAEVTTTDAKGDHRVAGVVSAEPAFVMNQDCPGIATCIALQGRVPVKVIGKVQKGDMLVSSAIPGYAIVNNTPSVGTVIGKAVGTKEDDAKGIVEVVVGRV